MADTDKASGANTTVRVVRSLIARNAFKVWVVGPFGSGYLRQGFAWKTLTGAINAAKSAYPLSVPTLPDALPVDSSQEVKS